MIGSASEEMEARLPEGLTGADFAQKYSRIVWTVLSCQ